MRTLTVPLMVLTLLLCLPALVFGKFSLTILHTGTLRGCYTPIDPSGNLCLISDINSSRCEGGLWHRAHYIESVRNSSENPVLLIDTGNFYQGTILSRFDDGSEIFGFMSTLRYDVSDLGPRDFDIDGVDSDGSKLGNLITNASFAVVASNLDATLVPPMRNIKKYVLFNISGNLVGVIGHVSYTIKLDSRGTPQNLSITTEIQGCQYAVDELQSLGVNKIIYVANGQVRPWELVRSIVSQVPGIDVVVAGDERGTLQSNTETAADPYPLVLSSPSNKPVLLVSAGRLGRFIGQLDVEFNDLGIVENYSGDIHRLNNNYTTTPFTELVKGHVLDLWDRVASKRLDNIGVTTVPLIAPFYVVRFQECPLGNLVADSIRAYTGADIAVQNGGGIGGNISAGNISVGNIYDFIPYINSIYVVSITGADLIKVLQNSVFKTDLVSTPAASGTGRFLQVSGVKFSYNPNANSTFRAHDSNPTLLIPDRLVSVSVLIGSTYQDVDLNRNYTMAINEFLLNGGNDYEVFTKVPVSVSSSTTLDAMLNDYITEHTPISPVVEGRIVQTTELPYDFFADSPPLPSWVETTSSVGLLFVSLSTIFLVILIVTFVFLLMNRKNPVLMSSSITFLCVILLGLILVCMSIFFWIGRPDPTYCSLRVWFLAIGYLLLYGAMLIKNWRLMRIFDESNLALQLQPITDTYLLLYLGGFILVAVLILALWTGVDPLLPSTLENSPIDPFSNTYRVICVSSSNLWAAVILIYCGALLMLGLVVSFRTRRIPEQYRESRYISWATYNLALLGVIGGALGFVLEDFIQASTAIVLGGILLGAGFSWGVMFVTKLIGMYDKNQDVKKSLSNQKDGTSYGIGSSSARPLAY